MPSFFQLSPESEEAGAGKGERREDGFRSLSDIPTFKICQIIFLSEELSSKYISISFDVFKYTGLNLQYKYIRLSTRDWYLYVCTKDAFSYVRDETNGIPIFNIAFITVFKI